MTGGEEITPAPVHADSLELRVASAHFSMLILAVHDAADASLPPRFRRLRSESPSEIGIRDGDLLAARCRVGLDHVPVAAVTVVGDCFAVDITFDLSPQFASAIFTAGDARPSSEMDDRLSGSRVFAFHTARTLTASGISWTFHSHRTK
ncbi:hypothetical protein [Antrihabitans spumae]|uniref:Uncharacterized protein n=1 Tax=Antrihabitans spumae TaxID=3373370 RepID=A0ABW7JLD8_9NOCA